MPCRLRFSCQFCAAQPDEATYASLLAHVRGELFGEYLDAMPGDWLMWTGRGILGPVRYACHEHRDDLQDHVRRHYGTVAWQAKRTGPFRRYAPAWCKPTPGATGAGLPRLR